MKKMQKNQEVILKPGPIKEFIKTRNNTIQHFQGIFLTYLSWQKIIEYYVIASYWWVITGLANG